LWGQNRTAFLSATYENYMGNARKARRDATRHLAYHRNRIHHPGQFPQRRVGGIVHSHTDIAALYMREAKHWHFQAKRLLGSIREQVNSFSFLARPLKPHEVVGW
jgi:hypothetical protein